MRTIQVLSATFYYKKYKRYPSWYLLDVWNDKAGAFANRDESLKEPDLATLWQAIMALRRLFKEHGTWDAQRQAPYNPLPAIVKKG